MKQGEREAVKGLFYSSLDPQQTKRHRGRREAVKLERQQRLPKEFERFAARMAYAVAPASAAETLFRHSGWLPSRRRVIAALQRVNGGGSRLERFLACGAEAVVEYSPSLQRHRVRANYCGDRLCKPCARARAIDAEKRFVKLMGDVPSRFITLTLQHEDGPLGPQLDHLDASFTRLRHSRIWEENVRGGVAVREITLNRKTGQWHVHLHVLCVGKFIDQGELSAAWERASRGSFVVHIRAVEQNERGAGYVAKYCSKGFDGSCESSVDTLLELAIALRGRRMFSTFGSWRAVDMEEVSEEAADWKKVDRVTNIVRAAGRGESWAVGILRSLRAEHVIEGEILIE